MEVPIFTFAIGLWLGFKFGVWCEDKFDIMDGYNYQRVKTPGGRTVLLPRRGKKK